MRRYDEASKTLAGVVRTREVAAMTEALEEQKLDVGLVLTESDREDIVSGKRTIKVRPLAGWLCGLDS